MHADAENGTNGKRQLPFDSYKRKTEAANIRLFAANENEKLKFVFLDWLTINSWVIDDCCFDKRAHLFK
jgi:hypothetical protein